MPSSSPLKPAALADLSLEDHPTAEAVIALLKLSASAWAQRENTEELVKKAKTLLPMVLTDHGKLDRAKVSRLAIYLMLKQPEPLPSKLCPVACYVTLCLSDVARNLCEREMSVEERVPAIHAFCIALTTTKGYKVVFTGDTRPCTLLDELAAHERQ